jgi:chemotaxis protein MotB
MFKKKKKHEEEQENHDRWLVSYADFITLLFAFFVTMYSVSRVDGAKLGSAVESLQRALGSVVAIQTYQREAGIIPSGNTFVPYNLTPIEGKPPTAEARAFEKLAKEIKEGLNEISKEGKGGLNLDQEGKGGLNSDKEGKGGRNSEQIKFVLEKRGLVIRISEHVFFKSGDASIFPEFFPILDVVAKSLRKIPNHIRIEGHTDSVPIKTAKFPSNWELSTARATTIVRYLLTHFDFAPERLSAAGYGEYYPVESNKTAEGRLQNRRVDFVVLSSKEMESEPQREEIRDKKESI